MSASAPQQNALINIVINDLSKDPLQIRDSMGKAVVSWISRVDGKFHYSGDGSGILPSNAAIMTISASSAIGGQNGTTLQFDALDFLDSKNNVISFINPAGRLGGNLS